MISDSINLTEDRQPLMAFAGFSPPINGPRYVIVLRPTPMSFASATQMSDSSWCPISDHLLYFAMRLLPHYKDELSLFHFEVEDVDPSLVYLPLVP